MRLNGTIRPGIIVTSGALDTEFVWMSDGWNEIGHVHPESSRWMKVADKEIRAAKTVKDGIKRLESAGFDVHWTPLGTQENAELKEIGEELKEIDEEVKRQIRKNAN